MFRSVWSLFYFPVALIIAFLLRKVLKRSFGAFVENKSRIISIFALVDHRWQEADPHGGPVAEKPDLPGHQEALLHRCPDPVTGRHHERPQEGFGQGPTRIGCPQGRRADGHQAVSPNNIRQSE